jgi:hypothetical protein
MMDAVLQWLLGERNVPPHQWWLCVKGTDFTFSPFSCSLIQYTFFNFFYCSFTEAHLNLTTKCTSEFALPIYCMPIPTASTLHAHCRMNRIHRASRGHGKTGWPIRSHGQECNLQYDTNRTVHHQSHLGARTQFVDSKQATPTALPARRCPDNHFRD